MARNDDDNLDGRLSGEQPEAEREGMVLRLVHVVLIALMISIAQTVLGVVTVMQVVLMLVNSGTPNARLGDFGTDLGIWLAKAARYQCAASDVKPWPWTDLD